MTIAAEPEERAALARRFGLLALDRLEAELTLSRDGDGDRGARHAAGRRSTRPASPAARRCRPSSIVPFDILFRPQPDGARPDEEVELGEGELDVVFYDGAAIDVGEAVGGDAGAEPRSLSARARGRRRRCARPA